MMDVICILIIILLLAIGYFSVDVFLKLSVAINRIVDLNNTLVYIYLKDKESVTNIIISDE